MEYRLEAGTDYVMVRLVEPGVYHVAAKVDGLNHLEVRVSKATANAWLKRFTALHPDAYVA